MFGRRRKGLRDVRGHPGAVHSHLGSREMEAGWYPLVDARCPVPRRAGGVGSRHRCRPTGHMEASEWS